MGSELAGIRMGIAYPGDPAAAGTWSGIPASMGHAIQQLGVEVNPLSAEPSRLSHWVAAHLLTLARVHRTPASTLRERARMSRTIALYTGREMSALRTRALRKNIRHAGPLAGVIQIGTGYALPSGLPVATYEDMTVRQALGLDYPEWRHLSEAEQQAGLLRQVRAYTQARACCFATRWAADSAVRDYGVSSAKVHVVGIGRNRSPRTRSREWDRPRFLFVGGDWRRKNGDAVMRAFVKLRQRIPEAQLDLVGNHPRVGADGVTGHGWLSLSRTEEREQLDRLFETATCLVMPSWCEPAGIVYLEAGAAGVPSIGSSVGGSKELIGDGGCVVEPGDDGALLEAMLTLADAETAREAGGRAYAGAHTSTWSNVALRLLEALDVAPPAPHA